jgi:hypothetical protein
MSQGFSPQDFYKKFGVIAKQRLYGLPADSLASSSSAPSEPKTVVFSPPGVAQTPVQSPAPVIPSLPTVANPIANQSQAPIIQIIEESPSEEFAVPSKSTVFRKDSQKLSIFTPSQEEKNINVVQKHFKIHSAITKNSCDKFGHSALHRVRSQLHQKTLGKSSPVDFVVDSSGNINFLKRRLTNIGEAKEASDAVSKKYLEQKILELKKELSQ